MSVLGNLRLSITSRMRSEEKPAFGDIKANLSRKMSRNQHTKFEVIQFLSSIRKEKQEEASFVTLKATQTTWSVGAVIFLALNYQMIPTNNCN